MSEVRLVSSLEEPDEAPVLILAPYQTPGPVTDAILGHLGVPEKLR